MLTVLALTAGDSFAQRTRPKRPGQQTRFGPETPIDKPAKLPEDVIQQLLEVEDGQLRRCLKDEGQSLADAPKHFAASAVNINNDAAQDLIVQAGSRCFMGAHLTTWWVFSNVEARFGGFGAPGHALVFSGRGDGLRILKDATYGYHDIETINFAGAGTQFYIAVWKFDGRKYVERVCTIENGGRRVRTPCR